MSGNRPSRASRGVAMLLLGVALTVGTTSCNTINYAINGGAEETPEPTPNVEARNDVYYDGLVSSEMKNLMDVFRTYLVENPEDFQGAAEYAETTYTPFEGVEWDYEIIDNSGYLIKVWTPTGGTSSTEETALVYDSTTSKFR